MIQQVLDGITHKLREGFGADISIYHDALEQGFKAPCFFVQMISPAQEQFLNNRFTRTHVVDVVYFPKEKDPSSEIASVTEKLFFWLKLIPLKDENGNTRASRPHAQIVDGVLHFIVNYDMTVYYEETPGDPMNEIEVNQEAES